MALPYKLMQVTSETSTYKGQFYPRAVQMSTIGLDEISAQVEENCSLKKSDVKACIEEMISVFTKNLQNGICVHLDGLGRFRMGIKGSYARSVKSFNAASNIKGYRVNFAPDTHIVKGTTVITNDDGTTYTKLTRTAVSKLTEGVTLKQIQ